jgi:hypothetical protein
MREWEEKQAERDAEAITDAHVGALTATVAERDRR